jgi:hypothetical protein
MLTRNCGLGIYPQKRPKSSGKVWNALHARMIPSGVTCLGSTCVVFSNRVAFVFCLFCSVVVIYIHTVVPYVHLHDTSSFLCKDNPSICTTNLSPMGLQVNSNTIHKKRQVTTHTPYLTCKNCQTFYVQRT